MADVVPLRKDGVVPERDGEPTVLGMLEEWTERARRGDIVAIAIAGVRPNGAVTTSFDNPDRWHHHLVSGVATLMHRLHA